MDRQGSLWVRQPAQSRQRPDLVVHDLLQRRRLHLRRRREPDARHAAGHYAVDIYLQDKKVAHPESAGWGTPQMIPRISQGHVVSCSTGMGPPNSTRTGQVEAAGQVALWPGAGLGFLGQAHPSVDLLAARRAAHQQVQPAQGASRYLALWLGSGKNSIPIVSDPVNTFNDAWAKEHMTAPQ